MQAFRLIPSIEQLRQRPSIRALEARFGGTATLDALRAAAASVRGAISAEAMSPRDEDEVAARIEALTASGLAAALRPSLQPVINATGVILHTNLGRAPLSRAAIERVVDIASGYCNLEYDLGSGKRGRRDIHAEALLCRLTGASAAVVVNNNAAAALLVLAALASGREVLVSRGELVEIGGGFRVPDVMAQSGAVLREVGTTNKTRVADYGAAIGDRTALILRVHPSNFRIEGFTERPAVRDLAALASRFGLPLVEDLGSGHLIADAQHPLAGVEPSVEATVSAGVDLCCFSGDKLLGGPQAGIIVGRSDLLDRIRRHPLMRALRVDKMTYAALEATLTEYATGRAVASVPVQQMLAMSVDELRPRAESLRASIAAMTGWRATLRAATSTVGGGSAPGTELPACVVAISKEGFTADSLEACLRTLATPIIARIENEEVVLDLRTVAPERDTTVLELLGTVVP